MRLEFDNEVLEKAIETYGETSQKMMLFEEMAELQKEVCKSHRGSSNILEIASEIADVYVMLEQLKMMYRIDDETVNDIIYAKINRLEKGMENERN